jgi:acyl-coenzyme A thioesterase PaaI-like protein
MPVAGVACAWLQAEEIDVPGPTGDEHPRARAARALRRFGHTLMEREADDDLLERVTEAAERTIAMLEEAPRRERDFMALRDQFFPGEVPDRDRMVHFDECFVSGRWNPLGIGVEVFRDGDGVQAEVVLGTAFEGAPGRSHGGIVAAIFDDVMGYLLTVHEIPAFTGELTVRYLKPTPMGTTLHYDARVIHRDGRRLLTEANCVADGVTVATATATFIEVSPSHFQF